MSRIETEEGTAVESDVRAQRDAQFKYWSEFESKLSPEVRYFVEPFDQNNYDRSIRRFENLVIARDVLPALANCDVDGPGVLRLTRLLGRLTEPIFTYGEAHGNAAKIFKPSLGEIGQALSDVDCTRIRECKRCKTIFWARANQEYCSKKCGNARRNWIFRRKPGNFEDSR